MKQVDRPFAEISYSGLKLLAESPEHYRSLYNVEQPYKDAYKMGSIINDACLLPDDFAKYYRVFDDSARPEPTKTFASKLNKEWKSDIVSNAEIEGVTLCTVEEIETGVTIARQFRGIYDISNATIEKTSVFDDFHGVSVRITPDWVKDGVIWDLKSTRNSPKQFKNEMYRYGYQYQAALYCMVLGLDTFRWAVVSKSAPHGFITYEFSKSELNHWKSEVMMLIEMYKQCRKTGIYPLYGTSTIHVI